MASVLLEVHDLPDGEDHAQVELTEPEAKEILMTMLKHKQQGKMRRYQGALKMRKNQGFGAGRNGALRPGTYQASIEELKKRTKCNRCHQVGHWARECPRVSTSPSK